MQRFKDTDAEKNGNTGWWFPCIRKDVLSVVLNEYS